LSVFGGFHGKFIAKDTTPKSAIYIEFVVTYYLLKLNGGRLLETGDLEK
jgi:hypothetical protein